MSTPAERTNDFYALHAGDAPLLLPNAWDAASAVLFQDARARAVATSSASLAWSLGWADGGVLPTQELLGAAGRMLRVLAVPLTVDIENGYSDDPAQVGLLAAQLARLGVAGINIEDGTQPPELLAAKVAAIRAATGPRGLFINARTDVFLRGLAPAAEQPAMAVARAAQYRDAGADGIFMPGLRDAAQVKAITAQVALPLNLMAAPGMAPAAELFAAGMRRLSLGPAPAVAAYGAARTRVQSVLSQGTLDGLYAGEAGVSYPDMQRLLAAK